MTINWGVGIGGVVGTVGGRVLGVGADTLGAAGVAIGRTVSGFAGVLLVARWFVLQGSTFASGTLGTAACFCTLGAVAFGTLGTVALFVASVPRMLLSCLIASISTSPFLFVRCSIKLRKLLIAWII